MAEPVRMIPEALSVVIQVKVSFDRLNTFLLDDELNIDDSGRDAKQCSVNGNTVEIQGGNFIWDQESFTSTLTDVNLEVKWEQKIAVCGPVGAGKSSLLYSMLGEIPKISGTVKIDGTLAYVSQTSWIQSGTVRDNILFGKPMDKTRYENAIKVCALDKDINDFSHGDPTEIGQRGINVSGGQKQRIQLARAVYNDADIYLLDDPVSVVDAHTAAILFNDCVMTALKEKTVILVTHHVEFLSQVDKILVMEGGKVTQSGNYDDLLTAGTAFEQLVSTHKDAIKELDQNSEIKGGSENEVMDHSEESHGFYLTKDQNEGEISTKGQLGVQLTQEEENEIGDVGWKPFWDYISFSRGSLVLCLMILAQPAFVALQTASTFWLDIASEIPKVTSVTLIGIYSLISFLSIASVYLRSFFAAHLGLKASAAFFSSFTKAIFNAPMLFFDSTPVGRILTGASSDLSILDFDIPYSITFVASVAIEIIVTIGIMASVTWQVLIVAIPAMVASKYIQGYYQASSREIIRINGTTKAPVMNFAVETSLGVVTIRAFNMVDRFFINYLMLLDTDATMFFYSNGTMEWLVLRIEVLQNLTVFTATLLFILLPQGYISPGLVGLSLSYAFSLTAAQVFWTRFFCNLSNYIISVERVKQFIHIPAEPYAIVADNRPPSSWPSKGRIDLQALEIRYRPNAPLVLKGITCTIKEGSRVRVVGRTGSGKTTLISALFRLVEPTSGDILIDGINISLQAFQDQISVVAFLVHLYDEHFEGLVLRDRRKYLMVVVSGGMNQQRNQIVDAVVIARILGAALVVPILQVNVIWGYESEFADIFDLEHFKSVLANDVRVVSALPSTHLMTRPVEGTLPFMSLPVGSGRAISEEEGVLLLRGLDSRLSKDLPCDLQKLRCKVAFNALRFAKLVQELGNKIAERMKSKGPYLALHLRMEKDVWVRTGCLPGLSPEYDEIVNNERRQRPELLSIRAS